MTPDFKRTFILAQLHRKYALIEEAQKDILVLEKMLGENRTRRGVHITETEWRGDF